MPKKKSGENSLAYSPEEFFRHLSRSSLEGFYREASAAGRVLFPDAAMEMLHRLIGQLAGDGTGAANGDTPGEVEVALSRFNFRNLDCEAHHYAVDLHYKTYRPRKGAPPHRPDYLGRVLKWREAGLTYKDIAMKLGFHRPTIQEIDRIRHQVINARKRNRRKS